MVRIKWDNGRESWLTCKALGKCLLSSSIGCLKGSRYQWSWKWKPRTPWWRKVTQHLTSCVQSGAFPTLTSPGQPGSCCRRCGSSGMCNGKTMNRVTPASKSLFFKAADSRDCLRKKMRCWDETYGYAVSGFNFKSFEPLTCFEPLEQVI